jgi:hypothetical protein
MHLTGFQLAASEWSAAAGYVEDSFGCSGSHALLGLQIRP